MAVQFILPPWLNRYESPSDAYQRGVELGNRMRTQEINTQIGERESIRRDQEAAVAEQYRQQQMDLYRREVAQKEQEENLKIQAAQRRFAAQQQYSSLVQGGMSAADAMMQLGPELGMPLSGLAQFYRASHTTPFVPAPPMQQGNRTLVNTGPNR